MALKVSVAICTWNGERWIEEQLRSILHQTRPVDEIILGDDRSSDGTVKVAQAILSKSNIPFQIIENEENLGSRRNFQSVCERCTGDIVFFSDQDDAWLENKVERILSEFEKQPGVGWVFSDLELCDEEMRPSGKGMWEQVGFDTPRQRQFAKGEQLEVALKKPMVTGAAMAIRGDHLKKTMPFQSPWIHDHWMSILLPGQGVIGVAIPDRLVRYRLHHEQQVGARQTALRTQIKTSQNTVAGSYLAECDALEAMKPFLDSSGWKRIAVKVEHFRARAMILETPRVRRIPMIMRELISGRYRLSWSAFAPLNDMAR